MFPESDWPHLECSGRRTERDHEGLGVRIPYLAQVVASLGTVTSSEKLAPYLDLLDHVLEDEQVTEDEAKILTTTARQWGLSMEDVVCAHRSYLESLVAAAVRDGKVTALERRELEAATRLLAIDPAVMHAVLCRGMEDIPEGTPAGRTIGTSRGSRTGRQSGSIEVKASWYEDEEWRGYVLTELRDDLLERHVFVTWVAGLPYFPDALAHPDFTPGSEIILRPEPDNPFDPNAIGVWNAAGTIQTGHVPAVFVRDLPPVPGDRHGLIVGEMVDGTERRGLWMVVGREPVMLKVEDARRPAAVAKWVRRAKDRIRRSTDRGCSSPLIQSNS